MNPTCERLREWLEAGPEGGPPPALEAHATGCETCRRRLALDRALCDRLGAEADLAPARRAALVARIAPAPAVAPARRVRPVRWPLSALAVAAAAVLAALVFWPPQVAPTLPTDVFGDLLGPLAEVTPQAPGAPAAEEDSSPLSLVLAAFWGDLEGPMAIGVGALEAPRTAAGIESAPPQTSTERNRQVKEE